MLRGIIMLEPPMLTRIKMKSSLNEIMLEYINILLCIKLTHKDLSLSYSPCTEASPEGDSITMWNSITHILRIICCTTRTLHPYMTTTIYFNVCLITEDYP